MATRAAIAAKDRSSKETIAKADRAEKRRQFEKSYKLEKEMQPYKQMESSSNTVKNLMQGAYGKGGLAGAMSSSSNDPNWYKKFNLNQFATNLPTFYRLGMVIRDQWLNAIEDTVPGIITFQYVPTLPNQFPKAVVGNTEFKNSPINQALTRFMAELRKLNSRIGDYDPADVGFYWYAIIGLMTDIARVGKAIKGYNTYYSSNKYLSKAFIKSCGFDPDDFIDNVQQYKASYMRWVSIFNSNAVIPNSLDLIKRYYWLATVVVRDHSEEMSQLYHFNMDCSMHLTDDETYVAISSRSLGYTYAVYSLSVDTDIQTLFNSVGIVTITADLRAAFDETSCLKLPIDDCMSTLIYSESMHDLEQIHNMRTLPFSISSTSYGDPFDLTKRPTLLNKHIVQSTDGYLAQGTFTGGNLIPINYSVNFTGYEDWLPQFTNGKDNQWLNFYDSKFISDDSILEATRFRQTFHRYTSNLNTTLKYNGTEIVTCGIVYVAQSSSDTTSEFWFCTEEVLGSSDYVLGTDMYRYALLSTFDWLPPIRLVYIDEENHVNTLGELDHVVSLQENNIRILHESCALSLYYVDTFKRGHVA